MPAKDPRRTIFTSVLPRSAPQSNLLALSGEVE
jgi:hypothetical protein